MNGARAIRRGLRRRHDLRGRLRRDTVAAARGGAAAARRRRECEQRADEESEAEGARGGHDTPERRMGSCPSAIGQAATWRNSSRVGVPPIMQLRSRYQLGKPEWWSKLEPVGKPPTAEDPTRGRLLTRLAWTTLVVVLVLAAVGAVLARSDAFAIVCVLALAALAGVLGWRAGEELRRTLQRQIDEPLDRAAPRAYRARDRPGRDRPAPLDGGRVPRRGHRATSSASGASRRCWPSTSAWAGLLRTLGHAAPAARRRQGRDSRRDSAEAGAADRRGARDRRDPHRGGLPAAARLLLLDPRHGRHDRAQPPREVGRQRLPARARGRGDPDRGAHRRRRRRLRRAHQRPRLPAAFTVEEPSR